MEWVRTFVIINKGVMRFFLIRHGQSLANFDYNIYKQVADHDIKLTEKGVEQSKQIGFKLLKLLNTEKVSKYIINKPSERQGINDVFDSITENSFKIWNSPYLRARQTSNIIKDILRCSSCIEDPLLSEQQYGLFNGLTDEQISELYPNEFSMFKLQTGVSGNFFSRIPMGESPFDVYCRLRLFIEKIYRQEDMITDHIIVCHGAVMRLLSMALLDKSFEYYDSEPEPGNCFVKLIQSFSYNYVDYGYIIKPDNL
jgi:broad specificity phosphatase PhoE